MNATAPSLDLDEQIARMRRQQVVLDGFAAGPEAAVARDHGLGPALLVACCALLAGLGALLVLAY